MKTNQEVKQGEPVLKVGSTGDSTGPHAHFEVRINGEYTDPIQFFEGGYWQMVLIFTDNEELDKDLNKHIENSRIVYYPDYILQENSATILIATIQHNKYNFKDFMFKVRQKNIRVILILENDKVPELKDALCLGIYDIVFDPFDLDDIRNKLLSPTPFSQISNYIQPLLEQ